MHPEGLLPDRLALAGPLVLFLTLPVLPAAAAAPKKLTAEVVAGVPVVRGTLDPAAVRKALKKGVPGLKPCFQDALDGDPAASGVGLLHVRLDDAGEVMMSTLLGPVVPAKDAPLARCVREKVSTWKVPGVKVAGLGFKVALTFGVALELKKKGPARLAAEARTTADPLPPVGSIAPPPPPAEGEEADATPEGYVLPAEVIPASGDDTGWVLEAEEATAEPPPPPPPPSRPVTVEIVNVRNGAGLDKLEVELVVKARMKEVERCWADAAAADTSLKGGQLVLSIHVVRAKPDKKGGRGTTFSVASVTREIGNAALDCIETAAVLWSFPAPAGTVKSVVTVTFKFAAE